MPSDPRPARRPPRTAWGATVVGPGAPERALVWGGFPLLGAVAGWLVAATAAWVASLRWIPFRGPFKLVASFPDPQATIGAVAVGIAAGVAVAFLAEQDYLVVTVEDDQVTVGRGDASRRVPRASIGAAFLDGKQLVLLGHATEELARQAGDVDAVRLEGAFLAHGYPWLPGGDPHHDEYRRWVEDAPEESAGANAILRARARTLDQGDEEGAAQLREDLAKLGIVVRDEKKRQYWRRTPS